MVADAGRSEGLLEGDSAELQLRTDLALASRILFRHRVLDAFGHVSVRHPSRPDVFLLPRRLAPGLVRADDVRLMNLAGNLVDDDGTPTFLERFIHSEIYAARPDVNAIVHSHSPSVISFGIAPGLPLTPVCHMCGFIPNEVPIFDMREAAGDGTDLLVRTPQLGQLLAHAIGQDDLILMRGHGSTVLAGSVPEAVYRAIYTETNARILSEAATRGPVIGLSEQEAAATMAANTVAVDRSWELWCSEIEGEL